MAGSRGQGAGGKKGRVVFSGLYFLWLLWLRRARQSEAFLGSFGGAKESDNELKRKGAPFDILVLA